jgi:2-polyprenyl-3-methyl-5-hydroxy-6-metoxy-1,4-benzoquinol methylase
MTPKDMASSQIRYTNCPGCGKDLLRPVFKALDHTVSGTLFEIWECDHCTLRFTQDVPNPDLIKAYYQSEDYISHTDTGRGFINRLYHYVRKRTLEHKRKIVSSSTGISEGSLLDLGAGTGAFMRHMVKKGWRVSGLEPDEKARERAAIINQVELLPVEEMGQMEPRSFDAISLWHVLEHLHHIHEDLDRLKKLLKPSGRILIAVPNYTSYDAAHYKADWAAYDVPRHLYHFSPRSMKHLLNQHGFQLHTIRPMWYDSFYISLLSEQYRRGKPNMLAGFIVGGISNAKAMLNLERCSSLIYIIGPA